MELPDLPKRCLAIVMLRVVDLIQKDTARITRCANQTVVNVEKWFREEDYHKVARICDDQSIKKMVATEAIYWGLEEEVLVKLDHLTQDDILRHYKGVELGVGRLEGFQSLATRLQDALSRISAKDLAIWSASSILTTWTDRGKWIIRLFVEQDKRFPLFLIQMQVTYPKFKDFITWEESLSELVKVCKIISGEVWVKVKSETRPKLHGVVYKDGLLLKIPEFAIPEFIYEFALDNYMTENLPELEVLPTGLDFYGPEYEYVLVPVGLPLYLLALGSHEEMTRSQKVVLSLARQYAKDERFGEIKRRESKVQEQAQPFQAALSQVLSSSVALELSNLTF